MVVFKLCDQEPQGAWGHSMVEWGVGNVRRNTWGGGVSTIRSLSLAPSLSDLCVSYVVFLGSILSGGRFLQVEQ